jgi:hypothetical protein
MAPDSGVHNFSQLPSLRLCNDGSLLFYSVVNTLSPLNHATKRKREVNGNKILLTIISQTNCSACYLLHAAFFFGLYFDPKDGGDFSTET